MTPATSDGLDAVDWSRPWLAPWRARGEPLARQAAALGVAAALDAQAAKAPLRLAAGRLRFVPHQDMPSGEGYEAFIHRTACVPTRPDLHDFFNGLVWLERPALKRCLNEWQVAHGAGGPGPRGPVRDALTLFDENGAWVRLPAALARALAARDWQALFVTHRAAWGQASVTLVGHALLEKLARPRATVTAHAWLVDDAEADDDLARFESTLRAARRPGACFMPLPVLGVPGWWPPNEHAAFYADDTAFRAARPPRSAAE